MADDGLNNNCRSFARGFFLRYYGIVLRHASELTSAAPLVGVVVDAASSYGRQILRGVLAHANLQRRWDLHEELRPGTATLEHWPDRVDLNLFMTAASAKWSLSSNARAHPAVAEILEAAASEEGEPGRQAREALSLAPGEIRSRTIEVLESQRDRGVW